MINYSIIIPHYNRQDLLVRCVDSIPQRDDVEVIIVDDHSDPGKVDFANFPGLHRKNTTCIFSDGKHGKGPGYARNVGLEKAQGKWVIFADSDDYFLPSMSAIMDDYLEIEDDVVYFKCVKEDCAGNISIDDGYLNPQIDAALLGNDDLLLYATSCPWAKLIKKAFLVKNNIYFEEIIGGDDARFSIDIARFTNKRRYTNESFYCVVMASDSLTRTDSWKPLYSFVKSSCAEYGLLQTIGRQHYAEPSIKTWWKKLYDKSRLRSLMLLPLICRTIGLRKTIVLLKKTVKAKVYE